MAVEDHSISVQQAMDIMVRFLENYWCIDGKSSDDIAKLLGSLAHESDGKPIDISLWNLWIDAAEEVTGQGA